MIDIISLNEGLLNEKVNIALVQLESPFYKELLSIPNCDYNNDRFFQWVDPESRKKKIVSILKSIKEHAPDNLSPDIIVFPEYSIPHGILPEIKTFSKDYKIIIAGSDMVRDRNSENFKKNVCPVIIKDMDTHFLEKNVIAEGEIGIIQEGAKEKSTLKICWEANGKTFCIQIFICLDFLKNHDLVDTDHGGITIVPMCSPTIKEYACRHYEDIRYGGGKFLSFCNAVSLNKDSKNPFMVGQSAIYGESKERDKNDAVISIEDTEGVIFARLDFSAPLAKMTKIPPTKPVESKAAFGFTHDYNLKGINYPQLKLRKIAVINPDLYRRQLELLSFVFLKTKKYSEIKNKIKNLGEEAPFNSYGVLGDHDTVTISFLAADDFKSLAGYLGRYTEKSGVSFVKVEEIIKFYKYDFKSLPRDSLDSLLQDPTLYEKLDQISKDWNTPNVTKEEREEFIDNKLIYGDYDIVDPIDGNLIRCFICLDLLRADRNQANLFETIIIREYLYPRSSVKSIYLTNAPPGFDCKYLLHVIDSPHEIFTMILKIHSLSEEYDIEVVSNTFVAVEQLSRGLFRRLSIKTDTDDSNEIFQKSVKEIIAEGESEFIEFKSSLRWDIRKNEINKELESKIIKTISGFLNSNGGVLLIGVDDGGNVLGLENDFLSFTKKTDRDGFELQITSLVKKYIGNEFLKNYNINFEEIEEKIVCKILVPRRCIKPVYFGDDGFYIRAGNSTQPLNMKATNEYIKLNWHE
jgi:hypothetical protein